MSFLRNAWHAATWSEGLRDGVLLPRVILGQPVVLYRTEDGAVVALHDACPHRFAPLHVGKLLPGGRVRCAYHGLQFDASGTCVDNPHGSGRVPAGCKVKTYPAIERHSMVWVWMGDSPADLTRIPDYRFLDADGGFHISRRDHVTMHAAVQYAR